MRPVWDRGFFLGSLVVALVQGAAIGAMVQELCVVNGRYAGGALEWLTPFAILCGLGAAHGYALLDAAWLVLKTKMGCATGPTDGCRGCSGASWSC
jgi:cytochrome d ubiquinol oxidase subunit II